jgi:sortase (surface protein transpeptidase)
MSDEKRKHKKHHTVRPYFTVSLCFVLISLIVALPLSIALMHYSVQTVHKAQGIYVRQIGDIELNDKAYKPDTQSEGSIALPKTHAGDKVAVLTSEAAGINCAVYFGQNRISRREGVGLSAEHSLMGREGIALIRGNVSGAFRSLDRLEKGDTVTLLSNWGSFTYKVKDITVSKEIPSDEAGETLVLATQRDKDAFAIYSEEFLTVICEKVSGPVLEEVAK